MGEAGGWHQSVALSAGTWYTLELEQYQLGAKVGGSSDCSVMITLCSVLLRALTGRAGGGQGGEHQSPAVHGSQRVGSAGTAGIPTH